MNEQERQNGPLPVVTYRRVIIPSLYRQGSENLESHRISLITKVRRVNGWCTPVPRSSVDSCPLKRDLVAVKVPANTPWVGVQRAQKRCGHEHHGKKL